MPFEKIIGQYSSYLKFTGPGNDVGENWTKGLKCKHCFARIGTTLDDNFILDTSGVPTRRIVRCPVLELMGPNDERHSITNC